MKHQVSIEDGRRDGFELPAKRGYIYIPVKGFRCLHQHTMAAC